jgi:replicative DNA helicase
MLDVASQTVDVDDPFKDLTPLDFEDIVIKTLFLKPELGSKIFPKISRSTMVNEENGKIIEAVKSFFALQGRYPGPKEFYDLYLTDENVKKKFKEIGNVSIRQYDDGYLKDKLQEFVRMRLTFSRLMEASAKIKSTGDVTAINAKILEGFAEAVSFAIESKTGISAKKDMGSFVDYLNAPNSFIPTFSPTLNHYIGGGYASKALTVWYGESNMGKTTYLCNDAAYIFSQGFDVLYVTLEMDRQEIMKKVVANLLEIPVHALKNYDVKFFEDKIREISSSDLRILEWPSFEVNSLDIQNAIKDLQIKEGFKPHIIFLDYINCMSSNRAATGGGKKHEDLGYITKEIENLAKQLDVPIVTCSQFNRNGYGNNKAGPKDVGESIDIYKYSANGIAILRDPTMIANGLYELNIIKNRYGPRDIAFLAKGFADIMKFREATDNEMQSLRTNEDSASEILSEARNFPK